jgi:hypothetical protein
MSDMGEQQTRMGKEVKMKKDELNVHYHYVIQYNTETGEFVLDYETQDTQFPNGPVWDPIHEEWRPLQDWEWQRDETAYNRAGDDIYRLVDELNKARKEWRIPTLQK